MLPFGDEILFGQSNKAYKKMLQNTATDLPLVMANCHLDYRPPRYRQWLRYWIFKLGNVTYHHVFVSFKKVLR